jgi:TPR repeat protein
MHTVERIKLLQNLNRLAQSSTTRNAAASRRFSSRLFPLLLIVVAAAIQPAGAKPRDLSTYPLRVHIFQSDWDPRTGNLMGGRGSGVANLIDGQDIHGIDFSYECPINYLKSVGNQAYAAKWKKPEKTIELVGNKVGNENKSDTCEFKVTLHDYVYDVQNGTLATFTQEQYKVRIGAALPKTGPVDTEISHYPLRLSVLAIDWTPLLNGARTGSGRGNIVTHTGIASVDFTTNCIVPFRTSEEGRYYLGQWTREGSTLALLLRTSGETNNSFLCNLQTSLHTDIYVRDASGAIKAVLPEEYRRTVLKMAAPTGPAVQEAGKPGGQPSAPAAGIPPGGQPKANIESAVEIQKDVKLPDTTVVRTASGNGSSGIALQSAGIPETTVTVTKPSKANSAGSAQGSAQAAALYRKACDGGSAIGCRNLAIMYSAGSGVHQDYAQAATQYRKGCNGGDAGSCSNLGLLYANGTGVTQDYAQAVTLYRKGCDAGDSTGCNNLGLMFAKGTGVSQDYTQATALYRKACDAGVTTSCSNLGIMYAEGTGVSQDYAQAVALYRKACDAGDIVSCSNLGLMFARGTGVSQDYAQAVALYRKACDAGLTASCGNLGVMYANGTGVPRDYTQAVTLDRKACDAGLVGSCVNLGIMYENGTGVSQDHTQALSLFRKACDGGAAIGCNNLGVMYEKEKDATAPPK